jgi:hypothetical protein
LSTEDNRKVTIRIVEKRVKTYNYYKEGSRKQYKGTKANKPKTEMQKNIDM